MDLVDISKAFLPKYKTSLFNAGSKPGAWDAGGSASYMTTRTPGALGKLRKRPTVASFSSVPHGTTPNKQQLKGMRRTTAQDAKRERRAANWQGRFGHLPGNSGHYSSQFM
jgi:hypothetical protein